MKDKEIGTVKELREKPILKPKKIDQYTNKYKKENNYVIISTCPKK